MSQSSAADPHWGHLWRSLLLLPLLLHSGVSQATPSSKLEVLIDRMDAARVQEKTVLKLVRYAHNTRFGRDHGFNSVTSRSFRFRRPLTGANPARPAIVDGHASRCHF